MPLLNFESGCARVGGEVGPVQSEIATHNGHITTAGIDLVEGSSHLPGNCCWRRPAQRQQRSALGQRTPWLLLRCAAIGVSTTCRRSEWRLRARDGEFIVAIPRSKTRRGNSPHATSVPTGYVSTCLCARAHRPEAPSAVPLQGRRCALSLAVTQVASLPTKRVPIVTKSLFLL